MAMPVLNTLLLAANVLAVNGPFRLALAHASTAKTGSARLRVDMLASAINQRRAHVERKLGFGIDVRVVDVSPLGKLTAGRLDERLAAAWPSGEHPHALITVKRKLSAEFLSLLAERCILACTDVLDQTNLLDGLIEARGLLHHHAPLPPPLLIVQTRATIAHIARSRPSAALRRAGSVAPLLAVVPHQHTNVGGWRVRAPAAAMRPIRRIGILAGEAMNLPGENMTLQLAAAACKERASLVLIDQHLWGGAHTSLASYECDAARNVVLPPRVTLTTKSAAGSYGGELADTPTFRMSSQAAYHAMPWVDAIDLALLWPAPSFHTTSAIESRPATRLLFWWSHGVPTVIYPFAAYVEAAQEANYSLPARGLAEHPARLPSAASAAEFSRVLRRLATDPPARAALAEAGLRAVQRYSPVAIGAQLVGAVHGAWRELQSKGSLCTHPHDGRV